MSYILFASSSGGITQPITLTADIDADDFSLINASNLTAGTAGLTIGTGADDIGFYGTTPIPQGTLATVGINAMPIAYDPNDLDFTLSVLVDGINNITLELQNLGLAS
tara:strand:+ start:6615 stop:6938 length:324 start_codon:yes stop_codon:yes gene_type:complete